MAGSKSSPTLTRSTLAAIALVLCSSSSAGAQRVVESRSAAPHVLGISRSNGFADGPVRTNYQGPARLGGAVGGWLVGMVVGGVVGYRILPHCTGCEDPGLEQIVYGTFVGGAFGAAIGAALPDLGSVCSTRQRTDRALLGAGIGALAGFLLGGGPDLRESALILVPAGSVAGALGSLGRCWNSRER